MLLHFMHAVTNDRDRVHTFLFGTRLTNVTRYLRHRDVDVALDEGLGSGPGLVGRHAHRRLPARVQPALVAPRAGPGRRRDPDHRRARPRRARRAGRGDGTAAQILPPPDLAQSAACAMKASSPNPVASGRSAACRRFPAGAQSGQPGRSGEGARPAGPRRHGGMAAGWRWWSQRRVRSSDLPEQHRGTGRGPEGRRQEGGAGHRGLDLGLLAPPVGSQLAVDEAGAMSGLRLGRLHRGRGRPRGAWRSWPTASRACSISASPTIRPGKSVSPAAASCRSCRGGGMKHDLLQRLVTKRARQSSRSRW